MNSAAFKVSRERYGLTQSPRKQPAVKLLRMPINRAATNAGSRRLILLQPAAAVNEMR
jgi:hypothetical protein